MEDPRKTVLHETAIVAVGEIICVAVMFLVFGLIHRFDKTVAIGGLIGMLMAIGNFLFMAISVSEAADKAARQDVNGGKGMIRSSYIIRMAVIFLVLCAAVYSGIANVIAAVLPLAFVRWIIMVTGFFRKSPAPESQGSIDDDV